MNPRDGRGAPRLWLLDWRERRGLTQQALHDVTGVSITTISTIENGHTRRIDFDTLAKLAAALGVEPACLFAEPGATLRCR